MKKPDYDTPVHQAQRLKLVSDLEKKGITDNLVLSAVANIPRHLFMKRGSEEYSYVDKAFPIGEGQTISQPYTVAYQTQLLQVKPLDKVLEIGTGSGYQAAVLAEIGVKLFTVERIKKLYDKNLGFDFLHEYNNIKFFYGDGFEGLPEYAPFDKILLTAATPVIPSKLVAQLATGGSMVLPLGKPGGLQRMLRVNKNEQNEIEQEEFDLFSFVPMLKGKN